ncbi:hypothetical protein KIW84_030963 [Lathyrus oleraceus]|uniref:Uncharacterized protein n=1 Tax=Pisum sativum TaxID=3888 RepID=A0A9D4XR72_PEA|nr:hypothetical protein KIW84_030963 [Pisum sativum]
MSRNKAHLVSRLVKLEYSDGQNMIEHLNTFKDEKLVMDYGIDSLLNEELRWRERGFNNQFEANIVDSRGRSENRERGGYGRSQARSKSCIRISCYYGGKPDHKRPECKSLKRDQQAGIVHPDLVNPKKTKEDGTRTEVSSNDENIFLVGDDNYLNVAFDGNTWIVDTEASFHITPHE